MHSLEFDTSSPLKVMFIGAIVLPYITSYKCLIVMYT